MEAIENLKIFILAAGFGTRLRSLTEYKPKALIEVAGEPILGRIVNAYLNIGIQQDNIVINAHYHADQIKEYLKVTFPSISVSLENEIRGTGGALFSAEHLLSDSDILIHNGDVYTEERLLDFIGYSKQNHAIATMMVRQSSQAAEFGEIATDNNFNVVDIANKIGREGQKIFMFTGIHYLKRDFWHTILTCKFCSIIDNFYIPAIKGGGSIAAYESCAYWNDMGIPERLNELIERLS